MSLHTVIQKYLEETKTHHDANNKIAEEVYCIPNKSSKVRQYMGPRPWKKTRMSGIRSR